MRSLILLLFCLLLCSRNSNSQKLTQEVISSAGGYYSNSNFNLSWTMGEVIIDTYAEGNYMLTQGFHQPLILVRVVDEDPVEFFNGFSPNGDGYNDYWNIPLLNKYPKNRVTIINRWGSEVWIKDDYDNNIVKFIGKNMNGEELADGTYMYSIIYGLYIKKGWVFIKR